MNEKRRKEIRRIADLLREIGSKFDDVKSALEIVRDEEREYYDNMHENLQSGDRGSRADEAASALEETYDEIENVDIDDLITKIEGAAD